MKTKILSLFIILFSLQSNAQLQQQNVADNSGFTTLYSLSTGLSAGYFGSNIQSQLAFNNHFNGGSNMNTFSAIAGGVENPSLDYGGKLYLRTANNLGTLVTALTIDKIQNSIFSGKVGIGTSNPSALLDLQKLYGNDVGIKLSQPGSSIWDIKNTASTGLFTIGAGGGAYFNIDNQTGNVGIGTTTPTEKLVVKGDGARIKIETSSNPTNYFAYFESKYDSNNSFNIVNQGTQIFGSKNIGLNTPDTFVSSYYGIAFATQTTIAANTNVRMYINQVGKVGIGTTNPDEKLTVKGKIHAEEIIVDLAVPADYVFQKYYTGKSELKSDYSMPTLAEIESFTKKNHHLPNVPSAQQIKQNGLSLGEMSNVLLQKVEELTLYAIEQNKVIEELKTQVAILLAKKQ